MQCGNLDWIPEQKEDISGKTGDIQIKSQVQLLKQSRKEWGRGADADSEVNRPNAPVC